MPKYRATVRLSGIDAEDAAQVRRRLAAVLRSTGARELRLHVEREGATGPRAGAPGARLRVPGRPPAPRRGAARDGGGLFLVIAITWAIWFFWFLAD